MIKKLIVTIATEGGEVLESGKIDLTRDVDSYVDKAINWVEEAWELARCLNQKEHDRMDEASND